MSKPAAQFISKLAEDPSLRAAFKNDPHAVMRQHGLDDQDREVLTSGDPKRVREHLGDDGPPGCMVIMFV